MATYNTNEFKAGLKIMLSGEPFNIIENEFVKPGKGQAFNRVRLRNLKHGRVIEKTFKSGETVEAADIVEMQLQYLYTDGVVWHFMHPVSYEQYEAKEQAIGEAKLWLKEQHVCLVIIWNGELLSVDPPNFVELQVAETDPGLKGDTSGGGNKPATLETGAVIKVPLFVQIGDVLKVDTRTGNYMARVKA